MNKSIIFCLFFLIVNLTAIAQDFSLALIPTDLQKNADAIIRSYETEFVITNPQKATEYVKILITVLNSNGDEYAKLFLPYDKFTEVKNVSGQTYNALGMPIKTLKKKDISDQGYFSYGTLYTDVRYKSASPLVTTYPYTVEYQYEIEYIGSLFYPTWIPQSDYNVAVQSATLKISAPDSLPIRYKNLSVTMQSNQRLGDNDLFLWHVENIKAFSPEPYSTEFIYNTPVVLTAPNDFELDGYLGNMSSWDNFGKWIWLLNKGRDLVPEPTKAKIIEMTNGMTDKKLIAKTVYEYMQSKTRYVSIQLGIGGWQPFDAQIVDKFGYDIS